MYDDSMVNSFIYGPAGTAFSIFYIAFCLFMIVSLWKIFEKAGQPGWAAIIPIYNVYIMLMIAEKPGWWLVLFLIPILNLILAIIVNIGIAERFGMGASFALGMIFLPFIFFPLLAFGNYEAV